MVSEETDDQNEDSHRQQQQEIRTFYSQPIQTAARVEQKTSNCQLRALCWFKDVDRNGMLAGSGPVWFVLWGPDQSSDQKHRLQEHEGPPRLGQTKTASMLLPPFMPGKVQQPSGVSSADWSLVPDVLGGDLGVL